MSPGLGSVVDKSVLKACVRLERKEEVPYPWNNKVFEGFWFGIFLILGYCFTMGFRILL